MKTYLKNERDYIKWCCNHKIKYFIYDQHYTKKGTIGIEYYPRKYDVKVRQYTTSVELINEWNNIVEAAKANNLNIEELFNACKEHRPLFYGCKWEVNRGGEWE